MERSSEFKPEQRLATKAPPTPSKKSFKSALPSPAP